MSISSGDSKYQGIKLGTNEPGGESVEYVEAQGLKVTVIDDDGGCSTGGQGEYMCANEGSCQSSDSTSACACKKGFGMRDCQTKCSNPYACKYRRLKFILACPYGGTSLCTVEKGLDAGGFTKLLFSTAQKLLAGPVIATFSPTPVP